jgi:hypothetical protein
MREIKAENFLARIVAWGTAFTTIFLISGSVTDPVNAPKFVSLGIVAMAAVLLLITSLKSRLRQNISLVFLRLPATRHCPKFYMALMAEITAYLPIYFLSLSCYQLQHFDHLRALISSLRRFLLPARSTFCIAFGLFCLEISSAGIIRTETYSEP